VITGNDKLLQYRLTEDKFLNHEYQKKTIDKYSEQIQSIVFQEKLGTVYEKVSRVEKIAEQIAEEIGVDDSTLHDIRRTASICKFDLPTLMVNEFPELQGVMGEKYARLTHEKEEVAVGIRKH